MKIRHRLRVSLLLGTGAVVACAFLIAGPLNVRRFLSVPGVATEEVRRGRFFREVSATGALKAVEATPLTVPIDASGPQKVGWMATDGGRVKAGDPVVLFDPAEMEKALADGKSDRQTASNKMEKIGSENRKTLASLDLDEGVVRNEKERAETFASKDPSIYSRNEIITSEIDREFLDKRLDTAAFKRQASTRLGAADLALGEIERSKAEIRIRQAEKGLGSLRLLAPHDGIIVFERNWRGEMLTVGETVFPGQKVAEIPNLGTLEAKVFVLEADAGGLKPGQKAKVKIDARPAHRYDAKVSRVDAMAKTRTWRSPTKYFETILSLERTDTSLMKPGQAVSTTIFLEEQPDVISVPRGAVVEKDGKRIVFRREGGRFAQVEVSLGSHSLSRVVVEKGLREGDVIALRDPSHAASEVLKGEGRASGGSGGNGPREN